MDNIADRLPSVYQSMEHEVKTIIQSYMTNDHQQPHCEVNEHISPVKHNHKQSRQLAKDMQASGFV